MFLTCMKPTLESTAILMKFTQNVCMDEKISWTKNFKNRSGGEAYPHRPTFLTCMEPALKGAVIFMKFTKRENFNPIGLANAVLQRKSACFTPVMHGPIFYMTVMPNSGPI